MNKRILIIVVILAVVLLIFFFLRFLSGEDNWICQNGQWVEHGNPSSSMPEKACP